MSGALLANHNEFISPSTMYWTRSGDLIVMVVLGGMGSVAGPVFGAVALLVLEEVLSGITEYWPIILGPLLLPLLDFFADAENHPETRRQGRLGLGFYLGIALTLRIAPLRMANDGQGCAGI